MRYIQANKFAVNRHFEHNVKALTAQLVATRSLYHAFAKLGTERKA